MDFVYIMVLFIDSKMLLCFKLALSPSPMEFSGVHVNLKVLDFLIDAMFDFVQFLVQNTSNWPYFSPLLFAAMCELFDLVFHLAPI